MKNMTTNKNAGDIDVATDKYIIEVKKSTKAIHMEQIDKYANMNNKYTVEMINQIKEKGVIVVNSLEELKGVLK